MAKQANRTMIGGFVVISIFILMASLVIFGSGRYFKHTETFILNFEGSIKGLNVGAPVLFQGVQVGSVTNIVIRANKDELTTSIPVTIEIEPDRFKVGEEAPIIRTPEETIAQLVDVGLRGVLTLQSFITGQLMIEFNFYPDSPAVYRDVDKEYPEIPTIKSTTERLAQSLQQIDIKGIERDLKSILSGVDKLVNDPDLLTAIHSLTETMEEAQQLVSKIDARFDPLVDKTEALLSDTDTLVSNLDRQVDRLADRLDSTLADTGDMVDNINRQVDPLSMEAQAAIRAYTELARDTDAKLQETMGNLDTAILSAGDVISGDSPVMVDLEAALGEIADAARSLRLLMDYLAQHPEALIQGKKN